MKLYELTKEMIAINDSIITAEGEITPELEKRLDEVSLQLTEKATGIRKWLTMIEGDKNAIEEEIKRLEKLKDQQKNLDNRLRAYIKSNMEASGLSKIVSTLGTFSINKNPESVECYSEQSTPTAYLDIVTITKPNKDRIKDSLKEGYEVAGWKLVNDKTHLRIK